MKFFAANPEPLKSWGICIIGGCVDKPTVQNFINVFVQTYIGHGGVVANKNPVIYESKGEDLDAAVVNCRNQAGNQGTLSRSLFQPMKLTTDFKISQVASTNPSLCPSRS